MAWQASEIERELAVPEAEQALQKFAHAVKTYRDKFTKETKAAWPDKGKVSAYDHGFGLARIHHLLTRRMQSLGLQPILARSGHADAVGGEWVTTIASTIREVLR